MLFRLLHAAGRPGPLNRSEYRTRYNKRATIDVALTIGFYFCERRGSLTPNRRNGMTVFDVAIWLVVYLLIGNGFVHPV